MQKVVDAAMVAAQSDTVVMLQGETGTGKGVLARWIHEHSERKTGEFVELNCSSLKGDFMRSELYGHAKGAFTSAHKNRAGLIEIADGGTLFLDEIGDMEPAAQAELLITLEEKIFRRLGENKVRRSDFRLICASNKDLKKESDNGRFRSDLFYRICVFPLRLPGLLERVEDIPALAEHFLQGLGYSHLPLNEEITDILLTYSWPGNVRELGNVLERAVLLARGNELSPEHFTGLEQRGVPDEHYVPVTWNISLMRKFHLEKAIRSFDGNRRLISKALGIRPEHLEEQMAAFQVAAR